MRPRSESARFTGLTALAAALTIVTLLPGVAIPAPKPVVIPNDDEGFTQVVSQRLKNALPTSSVVEKEPLVLGITSAGGVPVGDLSLARVKSFCSTSSPKSCDEAVKQFVAGAASTVTETVSPVSRSMIRLVIRPATEIDPINEQQIHSGQPRLILREFAPGLEVVVVLDYSTSVRYLTDEDLKTLKMSEEQAIAVGRANLKLALPAQDASIKSLPAGQIGQLHENLYESSRLLLEDDWVSIEKVYKDKLIVSIPAPNILLYAEGSDPSTVSALRGLTQDATKKADRALSDQLLMWTGKGWKVLP